LRESGSATLAYADATSPAVPVALFGAAWGGCCYAPLNFRLPVDSLQAQVTRLDKATLVGSHEITSRIGSIPTATTDEWMQMVATSSVGEPSTGHEPDPQGAAVILFTSGSSGMPKAALLSHDNLTSYVMETVEFASADSTDGLLLVAPPFHIAGTAAVLSSVYAGRRLLLLPAFSPEAGPGPDRGSYPCLRRPHHAGPDRAVHGRAP
jgi:acyl-CoA synthetase (AMP-forming)/AMP-acid ligase II